MNAVLKPTVQAADHRALRFLTAGSVDDGKSTLIGRLLFDSQAILADQLDTLQKRAAGEPTSVGVGAGGAFLAGSAHFREGASWAGRAAIAVAGSACS